MGDIDVGGDRSVMWKVNAGSLVANSAVSHGAGGGPTGGHGGGQHHQEGIDETNPDQFFTVYIEVPATSVDKTNLANALAAASVAMNAATPGSGAKVAFNLRIEYENYDHIKIIWDSR